MEASHSGLVHRLGKAAGRKRSREFESLRLRKISPRHFAEASPAGGRTWGIRKPCELTSELCDEASARCTETVRFEKRNRDLSASAKFEIRF